MKRIVLVVGLGVFLLASCKKDYTCQCTFTDSSPVLPLETVVTETIITGKRKDARTTCERGTNADGYYSTACELK